MTTELGPQRLAGVNALDDAVNSTANTLPLDTDEWTIDGADYPLLVWVNGELCSAAGATSDGAKVSLTGVTRGLNGVVKSHLPGAEVRPAHEFRMGLVSNVQVGLNSYSPPGNGGGDPASNFFWSVYDEIISGPSRTLEALGHSTPGTEVTRSQIDGILDSWLVGTGGTLYEVDSEAEWTTAMANVEPGDLVRVTSNLTLTADLVARGSKYGLSGSNMTTSPAGGTATLPIILTCADGVTVNRNDQANNSICLTVRNTSHVWVIGFNVRNGQFGIGCRNYDGTASSPCRIAWCDIRDLGHSGLLLQGWFQAIATSGGTPPAGAENVWGYSSNVVVENNTIEAMGQGVSSTQFGECIYLGTGTSDDGYRSAARNVWIRFNNLIECTADYVDIKPGCRQIYIIGNTMKQGAFHFGAAMQILYQGNVTRPSYYDTDPEIFILFNRIWDGDITNSVASSSNYVAQSSLAGVRFAFNEAWGFSGGGVGFRLRTEGALANSQSSDGEKWWIFNNLFWTSTGVANVGDNTFTPFNSAWVDARNNLGSTSTSNVEAQASTGDFVNPTEIPAVGAVGEADYEARGSGAAFEITSSSSLVGSGSSVSDTNLYYDGFDIAKRAVPSTPNPGPFQPA